MSGSSASQSSADGEAVLTVTDLKTHFFTDDGTARAVDGISFSVKAGETLCIVGESGCGKSVTSLSIMRLVPQPAGRICGGEIHFQGSGNLLDLSEDDMRDLRGDRISMIFQEPMTSLNPIFRIGEQIAESLRRHKGLARREAFQKAVEMLALVGIPEPERRAKEYPHQLSGGMRQRVMIAMALACGPKLMLADEPTTALDVTIQAQILDLMNDLKSRIGTAIILITHDLGVVAQMAQNVCVMYAGTIVEQGSVRALFKSPLHPYTQGLIASNPSNEEAAQQRQHLYTIPGMVPSLLDLPKGCRFRDRCRHAFEPCAVAEPPLAALVGEDQSHMVRCWLHNEAVPEEARIEGETSNA